ncbi:hypothetical protein HDU85_006783 [Gaertneriomyces sp. JEL0708]|nr:hypothetical protein HDU85_006783 [Gaertneriomyces sp. JEL0708]
MDDLIFDDEQQILAHVEISDQDKRTLQGVLISIPVITGLFTIAFAWGAKVLYSEFGWKIYKKIGADPAMRDMYRAYQIFLLLIKLDFFFMFSFGLQFLVLVIKKTDPEFAMTIAALPIMVGVVVLAVWGLRRESKPVMILFCTGVLAAISYFIFKLVRIHTRQDQEGYRDSKYYLSFFAALSLGTACLTLICAAICYNNFGKGLRQHLMSNRVRRQENHTEPVVVIDEENNHVRKPMVDD